MSERVRIDCNLDTVLFYTLKRLVDRGVCTPTTGFIGQNPEKNWLPPGLNYFVVTARKQSLMNAETATWAGEITVRVYAFSAVDIAMRDGVSLTQNAGNGIQKSINQVIAALQLYDMTNGAYYFLAQPMRYNRQDDIHRDVDRDSKNHQWSYCDIVFDLVYGEDPTFVSPQVNAIREYTYEYDGSFL